MAAHANQIIGVALLRYLVISFVPWVLQVDVEVADEEGLALLGSLRQCIFYMLQCREVGGWDVAPHDVKSYRTHHQLKS